MVPRTKVAKSGEVIDCGMPELDTAINLEFVVSQKE